MMAGSGNSVAHIRMKPYAIAVSALWTLIVGLFFWQETYESSR